MNNERIVFLNSLHLKKILLNKYLKLLEIDNKKILNLEYHHKIRQVINSFIFDINLEDYGSLFNKFYENRINKELILEKFDNIIDIFYDDMNKVDYIYNCLLVKNFYLNSKIDIEQLFKDNNIINENIIVKQHNIGLGGNKNLFDKIYFYDKNNNSVILQKDEISYIISSFSQEKIIYIIQV